MPDHFRSNLYKIINQSIETAAVAFVKGVNESNEFFETINKQ